MRTIFISYRREDAEGQAGRLFDDLAAHFGEASVFMDVAGIEPGRDFRRVIDEHVSSCGVLLAMIGTGWIDARDAQGKRRLEDPMDFVRLETASALKRDIPVVPVLVHGAHMPRPEQLPGDLAELAYRNGVELTHARWDSDVQVLIKALNAHVDPSQKPAGPATTAAPARTAGTPQAYATRARKKPVTTIVVGALAIFAVAVAGYVGHTHNVEKAEAERVATEKAKTAHAEKIAFEENAKQQANASKLAAEKAMAEQAEKIALEKAQRQAEANRAAAASAKQEADRLAADRARQQAAADRLAAEKARSDAAGLAAANARQQAEAQRIASEKAQAEARRLAAARAYQQAEAERMAADKARLDAQRLAFESARQQAAADSASQLRVAANLARAGICMQGYVWREAGPGDRVCVIPASRAQAAFDNRLAAMRRQPGGGVYGPATCQQGYIWRVAFAGDLVCVTPDVRARTAAENAYAATRLARASTPLAR